MYWHSPPCLVCISWFPPDISWCSLSDWKQLLFLWLPWLLSTNTATILPKPVPSISLRHFSPVRCCCSACQWFTVLPEHCTSMIFPHTSTEIPCKSWHSYSSLRVWRSNCPSFRSTSGQRTFTKALQARLQLIWVLFQKARQHSCYWLSWLKYSPRWSMIGRRYFIG